MSIPTPSEQDFEDLTHFELDPELIRKLDRGYCQDYQLVLLGRLPQGDNDVIPLGMVNPGLEGLILQVEQKLRRKVRPVQINAFELEQALEHGFRDEPDGSLPPVIRLGSAQVQFHLDHDKRITFDPSQRASQLVLDTLSEAVRQRASDVHIEVYGNDVDLRYRIDGVMQQVPTPISRENVRSVISCIKAIAEMDIADRLHPADGHVSASYEDADGSTRQVDFRISTLPGPYGEDVVIRVLDAERIRMPLQSLGMAPELYEQYRALLHSPGGMILVTGPTASGKTSTLYASIEDVNSDNKKVLTVEDPIESVLPKVNQKQVSEQISFSDYTRAFMRQNPDVVVIGEVRDHETMMIALRAAQMGHLVMTTVHTIDSPSAVERLTAMGADRSMIASGLLGVLAQRLMRRNCQKCMAIYQPNPAHLARLPALAEAITFKRGEGCDHCDGTGFHGRIGAFELLVMNEDLRAEVARGTSIVEGRFREKLTLERMVDDARNEMAEGLTTVEEILRTVPIIH